MSLVWQGLDLQPAHRRWRFWIAEGRDELPEVRSSSDIIPFRRGRLHQPAFADRRVLQIQGYIKETTLAAMRAQHDTLKGLLDPEARQMGTLVDDFEDGSQRWIHAIPRSIIPKYGGNATRLLSIELEALDPYWYGLWGRLALDAPPLTFGPYPDPYRAAMLATNPLAWWRTGLRDIGGTVAYAEVGADGTWVNAPTLGVPGLLAGDPDTAVTGTGLLAGSSHMTFALPDLAAYSIGFHVKGGPSTGRGFDRVFYGLGDRIDIGHDYAAGNIIYYAGAAWTTLASLAVGETAFCVFTYDGATTAFYENGVSVYSAAAGQSLLAGTFIWGTGFGGSEGVSDTIDEPAIWDRAVTPGEIAGLCAAGTTVVPYPVIGTGWVLDGSYAIPSSAEVVITAPADRVEVDTLGTADIERIRVQFTGPSSGAPGFLATLADGSVVGFTFGAALAAGQKLVVNNGDRTVLLDGVGRRDLLTLLAGNEHGEYMRLSRGVNQIRITGQPSEARIQFTPAWL